MYVLDKDAHSNRVVVGPRAALCTERVAIRAARLRRAGASVDRVKLRYRAKPISARVVGDPDPGRHARLELELGHTADAVAPGQLACLMDGELVVGYGTIARS